MGYRTYINGTQVFGNHERYPEWIAFIQSQGITVNENGEYKGEITDFMGALAVVEQITLRIEKERALAREQGQTYGTKSIFDWTHVPADMEHEDISNKFHTSLCDKLFDIVNNGYAFMPLALYYACADKLDAIQPFTVNGHCECFKVKDGESLKVEGG